MDDLDDLDLLWCPECQHCHGPDCPRLGGPPARISDTPIQSRAVATLPSSLSLQTDHDGVRGVIACQIIAKRTQFGPLDAPKATDDDVRKNPIGFLLKIFHKDGSVVTLNQSNENQCNWMCLVRPATNTDHQNLIAYQYKSALYYSAIEDIPKGVELRVWYAPHYAPRIGQPLLSAVPKTPYAESESDNEIGDSMTIEEINANDDDATHLSPTDIPSNPKTIPSLRKSTPSKAGSRRSSRLSKENQSLKTCPKRNFGLSMENQSLKTCPIRYSQLSMENQSSKISSKPSELGSLDEINVDATPGRRSKRLRQTSSSKIEDDCIKFELVKAEGPDGNNGRKNSDHVARQRTRVSDTNSKFDSMKGNDVSEKKTPCPICRMEYSKVDIDSHVAEHAAQDSKSKFELTPNILKCNSCSATFEKAGDLQKHCTQFNHKNGLIEDMSSSQSEHSKAKRTKNGTPPNKMKHACKECDQPFATLALLNKHCKSAHNVKRVRFRRKKGQFLVSKESEENLPQDGKEVKPFQCTECDMVLSNETLLCKHLLKIHNVRGFSCKNCPKVYSRKDSLLSHRLTHLKVVTASNGKKGVITIPEPKEMLFKCKECVCEFHKWDSFKKHMTIRHGDTDVAFCDVCCTTHGSGEDLDDHMAGHDWTEMADLESLHECDVCHSLFLTPFKLKRHKDQHTKRKDHVCEICGKAYGRPDALQRHKDRHEGKQPTGICVTCGLTFQNVSSLTIHMRLHEEDKKSKTYTCNQCEKCFTQLGNYNKHLLTHAQSRQFKCDICECAFNHAQSLKRHKYIHMENASKKHKCQYCELCFYEKYSLNKHTRDTHLKKRSCTCEYCGLYFKRRESYYRHMKAKHVNVAFKDYEPLKGLVKMQLVESEQGVGETEKGENGKEEGEMEQDNGTVSNQEQEISEKVEEMDVQQEEKTKVMLAKTQETTKAKKELQPSGFEGVLQPIESGKALQPTESVEALQPSESGKVLQPYKFRKMLQPLESGKALQPLESGKALQPLESGKALQPTQSGKALQPTVPGKVLQPNKSGKARQQSESIKALQLNESRKALQPSGSQKAVYSSEFVNGGTSLDFSQEGELVKALTKLQQTISNVTSSNQPSSESSEPVFPVTVFNSGSEVLLPEQEINALGEKSEDPMEENTGLYLVMKSCERPLPGLEDQHHDHVVVEHEDQITDPNIMIMNFANVETFITLNTTEEDDLSNQASADGQTLVCGEQILESESCRNLAPTVEETITASISPGPMLGNQSLISMPGDIFARQIAIPSAIRSETSVPKSTPVSSFISIESLLNLPSSSSSSIPISDPISTTLATHPITNWQPSSHSNSISSSSFLQGVNFGGSHSDVNFGNHGNHQGVKFSTHAASKHTTNFSNVNSLAMPSTSNFSNVNSLAMPSTSSGIQRPLNMLLEPLQPAGQTIDLSQFQPAEQTIDFPFLTKSMNRPMTATTSLKSLQESSVGVQQFVPITPSFPHIPTTTI